MAENGWFLNTNPEMTLYIPSHIYTNAEDVAICYGAHWNAYQQKEDGTWEYISYRGYTEPTTE